MVVYFSAFKSFYLKLKENKQSRAGDVTKYRQMQNFLNDTWSSDSELQPLGHSEFLF